MRTYQGKCVDESEVLEKGFYATVSEEGFEVSESFRLSAYEDCQKYYPDDYAAEQESAYMDSIVDLGVENDKPKYIPSPTFAQKMLRADEVLQDRYDELKNYALRFKKIKSRISKKFDSFNQGRLQFVKLSVAGKTLKLYLNMDINTTDPKFHCKDVSDRKTYVTVPVLLRIKSGRAVRYAKILIDQCAAQHGLVESKKFVEVDAIGMVEAFLYGKNNSEEE